MKIKHFPLVGRIGKLSCFEMGKNICYGQNDLAESKCV